MSKTNYIIAGVIVILIITAAIIYSAGNSSSYTYSNGKDIFTINKINDIETKIPLYLKNDEQPYTLVLRNDPKSLENIPVYGNPEQRIVNDEAVAITIDPYENLTGKTVVAVYEISNVLSSPLLYNLQVYTTVTEAYQDKSVINCNNATDSGTVIYVTLGETTQIFADDYCIIIMGTSEDELIRAADRFVLHALGIMK